MSNNIEPFHIYGSKAALYVKLEPGRDGRERVRLEIASKRPGARQYDWDHKIAVQMTSRETRVFLAILYGWKRAERWDNRGKDHTKSFSLEHQGTHLYLTIREAGDSAAIQISPPDAFHLALICLEQIKKTLPFSNSTDILTSLKATVGRMGVS